MWGKREQTGRDVLANEAHLSFLYLLKLILAVPRAEQWVLPGISYRNFWLPHAQSPCMQWRRPQEEASGTGGNCSVGPGHQHLHAAMEATD